MITVCPFCDEKLISEDVKTTKGGTTTQLNCPLHGYIDNDVQKLAMRFNALKSIFARYHKSVLDPTGIKDKFNDSEWLAIESLDNEN